MADVNENSLGMRNWQSARTLLELLIFAAVVWFGSSTQKLTESSIQLQTQMQATTSELRDLRAELADLPLLARGAAKTEVRLDEHERRITNLEQRMRGK